MATPHENLITEDEQDDGDESSGIVTYGSDGKKNKAITAVISTYQLEGDEIRANLLAAMRGAILESQRAISTTLRALQMQRQRRA